MSSADPDQAEVGNRQSGVPQQSLERTARKLGPVCSRLSRQVDEAAYAHDICAFLESGGVFASSLSDNDLAGKPNLRR